MEWTHANRPEQSDERRQPNVSGISRLRTFGVLLKTNRFMCCAVKPPALAGGYSVAIPLRRVSYAAMHVVWKWKKPYSVGLSNTPIVLTASVCANLFRAFGREPISHAHQSPLIIHVLLGRWGMSLRVADCLIPPHVIYYTYQANGLIYNPRSCNEHHRKTVRSPLCITDTCVRDSSPAHTQPKGQHQ